MATTWRAHFDGKAIQLDEPADLQPQARLLVTVLDETADLEEERRFWSQLGAHGLSRAYGDNEPEYSESDCIP